MPYWVYAGGKTVGPLRILDILDRATPETLISHGNKWLPFGEHPDFAGSVVQPTQLPSLAEHNQTVEDVPRQASLDEPELIPCEDASVGLLRGLLPTLRLFLLKPQQAFTEIRSCDSLLPPVVYSLSIVALIVCSLLVVTSLTWSIFDSAVHQEISGVRHEMTGGDPFAELFASEFTRAFASTPEYGEVADAYRSIPKNIFAAAVGVVAVYMIFTLLRALFTHLFLVRFGALKPRLLTTVRVALYSTTPNLLVLIFLFLVSLDLLAIRVMGQGGQVFGGSLFPFLLVVIWFVWTSLLEIKGFRHAYGLAKKEAIISVGLPHFTFAVVTVTAVFFGMLVLFGAAMTA